MEYHKDQEKKYNWKPRERYGEWEPHTIPGRVGYPRAHHGYDEFLTNTQIIFKLPKETPKGQYLLRAASVWQGSWYTYEGVPHISEGQLYHSCAQIQVESDATGSLPKGVLIPEAFQYDKPGQ